MENPFSVKPDQVPLDYYEGLNPLVLKLVPLASIRILEVGCAKGKLGAAIKKRNSNVYYIGIELFQEAADIAKKELDRVFVSDVEHFDWTKLAGEHFDCIIFADVLEHLVDPASVFQKATAFLSSGGNVVCCIPNVGHWSVISNLIRGEWNYTETGLMDRTHLRFFTMSNFKIFLRDCGFEAIDEERWFTEIELQNVFFPLLQAMKVDPRVFINQATTIQFVLKIQRIMRPNDWNSTEAIETDRDTIHSRNSISIVITVNNNLRLTRECLDSIDKSLFGLFPIEVIVVDDASTDGTVDLLVDAMKEYSWLHFVRCERPIGFARARNRGASIANAEYLIFMDGNSVFQPKTVEKMIVLFNDVRVGLVSPQLSSSDGRILSSGIVFTPDAQPILLPISTNRKIENRDFVKELPAVLAPGMMIRRGLFNELEGFSTVGPIFYADLDFCFKVRRKGLGIVHQKEGTIIYLDSAFSSSQPMTDEESQLSRKIFIQNWKELLLKELGEDPLFYLQGKEYRCN